MNPTTDLPNRALAAFAHGPEALVGSEYRLAKLGLLSDKEAAQFEHLAGLIEQYLRIPNPARPLCLAVFGAPGSGKSRLVRALPETLPSRDAGKLRRLVEINLTQVTAVEHLASAVLSAQDDNREKTTFVFFDEFDAKRDGAPWGWLSWFLAPMQDGVLFRGGERHELKNGVYVFAGGTADTFEDFGITDPAAFAVAKGPDFISRLRGYLNVLGVNADHERECRRALVLRHQLRNHGKNVDESLLMALLHVGRYKHGARSIEALIELMPCKETALSIADIRDHPLLGMHVDRGPLDPSVIGGCIGLSGSDFQRGFQSQWDAVCMALFGDGASLACAGWAERKELTHQLERVVTALPERLELAGRHWIVVSRAGDDQPEDTPEDTRVERLAPPPVESHELSAPLHPVDRERLTQSLELFRMRHQLALRTVAWFAIGGRLDSPEHPGRTRYPGVPEELMLAIALKCPVYICGAFGGGAAWAGGLLGLDRKWTGLVSGFDYDRVVIPTQYTTLFRPPPLTDLPLTRSDLITFFQQHALGGPHWVNNGLSAEENRSLFETKDKVEIATLVRRGLRMHFSRLAP